VADLVTLPANPRQVRQEQAQLLLDLGFKLFPLRPGSKEPLTPKGFHDAQSHPARVMTFLQNAGEPNYGIAYDGDKRYFLWDIDGGDGTGSSWREMFKALETQLGKLPPTWGQITPSGGWHLIYEWPEAAGTPPDGGKLLGFTVRWPDKGYIVGPGSVVNGIMYARIDGPNEIATLPMPWALAALDGVKQTKGGLIVLDGGGYQLPESVGEGGRYDAIRDFVASRYNRGLTEDEMWTLVRENLAPRFTVALTEWELKERFTRAVKGMAERLGPPAVSPDGTPNPAARISQLRERVDLSEIEMGGHKPGAFPPELLPEVLSKGLAGEVIENLSEMTKVSQVGMLTSLLTMWGGLFGCQTWFFGDQPSSIFSVLVGETGRAHKGTMTSAVWRALEGALDNKNALIAMPLKRQQISGLASGESIIWRLSEAKGQSQANPAHMVAIEREFEKPLKKMRSAKDGYQSTLGDVVREVFDGEMLQHIKVGSMTTVDPPYTLSILGNITPTALRQHLPPQIAHNGFGNRFLWVPVRDPEGSTLSGDESWNLHWEVIEALRAARDAWLNGAREFRLDKDASQRLSDYYEYLGELPKATQPMTVRLPTIAARLALAHASLDSAKSISREMVDRGIALTEYSRLGLGWCFANESGDEWTDTVYDAVVSAGSDGLPAPKVWALAQQHAPRVRRARVALVDGGLVTIERRAPGRGSAGGRPAEVWKAVLPEDGGGSSAGQGLSKGFSSGFFSPKSVLKEGFSSISAISLYTQEGPVPEQSDPAVASESSHSHPNSEKPLKNHYETSSELLVTADNETQTIKCHFYSDHQSEHRLIEGVWVCPICVHPDDEAQP
jgi:hypothetical protein